MRIVLQCYDTSNYVDWQGAGNACAIYEMDVTDLQGMLTSDEGVNRVINLAQLGASCLDGGASSILRFRIVTYP